VKTLYRSRDDIHQR